MNIVAMSFWTTENPQMEQHHLLLDLARQIDILLDHRSQNP